MTFERYSNWMGKFLIVHLFGKWVLVIGRNR